MAEGGGFVGGADSGGFDTGIAGDSTSIGPGFTTGLLAGGIAGGMMGNAYGRQRAGYPVQYGTVEGYGLGPRRESPGLCGGSQLAKFFFTLAWLSLVATILGAILTPKPGDKLSHVLAGDRVLVSVDTNWYDQAVIDKKTLVDTYVFVGKEPRLNEIVEYDMVVKPNLPAGGRMGAYHYARYDLYEGSSLKLDYSFLDYNIAPYFTVMRGAKDFVRYSRGQATNGVIVRKQASEVKDFTFKISERDAYYLVWSTKDPRAYARDGKAMVHVTSRTFSTKDADAVCQAGTSCDLSSLSRAKGPVYLLFVAPVPGKGQNYDQASEYPISYELKGRSGSWMEEFIPLATMLAACTMLYLHFRTKQPYSQTGYEGIPQSEDPRSPFQHHERVIPEQGFVQPSDEARIYPNVPSREAPPLPSKEELARQRDLAYNPDFQASAPPAYNG